jgi:predicted Zn-dependent protease
MAGPAASSEGVDPFYASRFHEGLAAYDRGDHHEAAFSLRLACFGMLDLPEELAECLVWLAMAQARSDDREGFASTFRRLAEGEELVGLYSRGELPAELRSAFEARALEWIPPATLAASPAFAELSYRREEQRLASLSPRARRSQLQELMRDRPREARWPALLARLEQDEGRAEPALEAAERALRLSSEEPIARCAQGWALARLDRCAEALDGLEACSGHGLSYAAELLRCRVEAEEWDQARRLLAAMEPSWQDAPAVARMAEQVRRHDQAPLPQAIARTDLRDRPVGNEASGDSLPASAQERLAQARSLVASARTSRELEEVYLLAQELVEAFPEARGPQLLAGEIAYRASRWRAAVEHFRRAGPPDPEQPQLVFYFAVALYESGNRAEAAEVLRCCVERLRSTPFVEQYVQRIQGGS